MSRTEDARKLEEVIDQQTDKIVFSKEVATITLIAVMTDIALSLAAIADKMTEGSDNDGINNE